MEHNIPIIQLKAKVDASVRRRHPWVFSRGIDQVKGSVASGDLVRLEDGSGAFLAWGLISPTSQIRVRILDWEETTRIDDQWWADRISESVRRRWPGGEPLADEAQRLVFSESDLLPGLIADWYNGTLVFQALTAGIDRRKDLIVDILSELTRAERIFERSDAESRRLEGLAPAAGLLQGPQPEKIQFREAGLTFQVDPEKGQKTGFFLDQRDNRSMVAAWAGGRRVLDVFSYTGAFAAACAAGGAESVLRLDSSAEAVRMGRINMELNGFSTDPDQELVGDAFSVLRTMRDKRQTFDLIILDPPKFAPTRSMAQKAARAYKDINLLALKLLSPEGILASFSCSRGVDEVLFQQILFGASHDAGRNVQILKRMFQAPDHPVLLSFPESAYLKGVICRVF